ncbi:MAG: hypothetical protein COB17_04635 [Sulfurimonas sp.]|nr:MAG: hypothetical protein COB17_04635 [Sulfurimonas sp.]
MFEIIFYLFSSILAYLDYKKFIVPNKILFIFLIMLLISGLLENKLNIISFYISFALLIFFSTLLILKPKLILGGGDIKYMMIVSIFLQPILFPFFMIITGLMQSLYLIYVQIVQKKRKAAMLPAMFISVLISNLFYHSSFFPFQKIIGQ